MPKMTLEEFLKDGDGSSNIRRLKRWQKRDSASLDSWLHSHTDFCSVWRHSFPKLVEPFSKDKKPDDEPNIEVWGESYNCSEDDATNNGQYFRNNSGGRDKPPKSCPMCKMIEEVRCLVHSGKLDWMTPLFKFEGTDPQKSQVRYAAGLYGGFNFRKLDADQEKALKKISVNATNAWQQSSMSRKGYLFVVVDNDNVDQGVRITIETAGLGDAVKSLISDEIVANGASEGNPLTSPYCIKWQYFKNKSMPSEKYNAVRLRKIELSKEVRELINSDPPDVESHIKPADPQVLRALFEEHYCGPKGLLNWDKFFGAGARVVSKAVSATAKDAGKKADDHEVSIVAGDDEEVAMVDCKECGKPMPVDDTVCGACGFDHEETGQSDEDNEANVSDKGTSLAEWPTETGDNDEIAW